MLYHQRPKVKVHRKVTGAAWRRKNRKHLLAREAKRKLTKRAQCLIANARTRARNRGITFDLDGSEADFQRRIDAGHCELTGMAFDLSPGRRFNSPSLDRIIPAVGYVPSNIRIVCHAINAAMGTWGEEPIWRVFESWRSRRKPSSKRGRKP